MKTGKTCQIWDVISRVLSELKGCFFTENKDNYVFFNSSIDYFDVDRMVFKLQIEFWKVEIFRQKSKKIRQLQNAPKVRRRTTIQAYVIFGTFL